MFDAEQSIKGELLEVIFRNVESRKLPTLYSYPINLLPILNFPPTTPPLLDNQYIIGSLDKRDL